MAAGAQQLSGLMDEADAFCRSEELMTVARSPVLRAFSAWYLSQFVEQTRGEPPVRWTGPLDDV